MRKFIAILLTAAVLSSCRDKVDDIVYVSTNLPMSGLQEVPAKTVAGNGTIDAYYNKGLRTLYYTVKWNSLTGPITGFHIHGSASTGFNAPIIQNFSGYSTANAGTFSGTVFIDGVVFKEEELLQGQYYINIHTSLNPGGEIRGQLVNLKLQ